MELEPTFKVPFKTALRDAERCATQDLGSRWWTVSRLPGGLYTRGMEIYLPEAWRVVSVRCITVKTNQPPHYLAFDLEYKWFDEAMQGAEQRLEET
jgi:hypothetical protein